MPCEDEVISQDENTEFHQVENSHSSQSSADDCSPFCQCHCCHVHMLSFNSSDQELISLEISSEIPEINSQLGDDIPNSFFQPPRI